MSRTLGGRNRSSPPSSGAIDAQAASSSRRQVARVCVARRTNEPSRTNSPSRAALLQGDDEDRRRQPRLQQQPQLFPADALLVGIFGVIGGKLLQRGSQVKIRQRSGETAILDAPDSNRTSSSCSASRSVCAADKARSRANAARSHANGGAASRAANAADGSAMAMRVALRLPLWRTPPPGGGPQIDESAAADRALSRHVSDDVAIRRPRRRSADRAPAERRPSRQAGSDRRRAGRYARPPRPRRDAAAPETTGRSASPRPAARAASRRCGPSARATRDRARCRRAGSRPWRRPDPPN